jgi:hypothetical protein
MFARQREEVIPRLRLGISIKKVMILVFFIARHFIALDALYKGQKYKQEYFVQNILPSLFNEKKRLSRQKSVITFAVRMDNSACRNAHRVVNELRGLNLLRAPHPPYSPDISPHDF